MANAVKREQFDPLFRAIAKLGLTAAEREETTENYMFMYREEGINAYKHYWTRVYVYVNDVGAIEDGLLDTGSYNDIMNEAISDDETK